MKRNSLVITLIFSFAILSSCKKKEGCMDPNALNYDPSAEVDCCCEYAQEFNLSLHLHNNFGTEELAEGDTLIINGITSRLDITRFYISNIRMVDADGNETPSSGKYILVTPGEEEYPAGILPSGDYTKIRFDIGIDSATNHGDPSIYPLDDPLGPQFPNMHWGWDFGYIFLRIDGLVDRDMNGSLESIIQMHLGLDDYLYTVEIDYPFNAEAQGSYVAHLVFEWQKLFVGVDMTVNTITHTSDNWDLADILYGNLPNVFSKE